ncbi:MAG: class I SAM-dependent methyltransferase [archaeon]|nr:class I SAM-dependent methyltransferase [archaeon]
MIKQKFSPAQVYDIVYHDFTNKQYTQKEINFIKQIVNNQKTLLDVGCGTGRHTIPLIKAGFDVIGLDNSKGMLEVLKEKLKKGKLTAKLINKDILKTKTFNQKFGGIICFWNVFSEIAKTDKEAIKALKLFIQSLEKQGILIIEQTNPSSFNPQTLEFNSKVRKGNYTYETAYNAVKYFPKTNSTLSKEIIKITKNGKLIKKLETIIEQRWWRKQELQRLCKKAGFKSVKFYESNFHPNKKLADMLILVAIKD